MKLNEILERENHQSGAPPIEEDSLGVKRMWINDQHLIHFRSSPEDKYFYVYAKISIIPKSTIQNKIYETLLAANLFGEETGNSVLALHVKSNSIILMRTFESDLTTYEYYLTEFQSFIDYLVHWKEKTQKLLEHTPSSSENMLEIMSKRNQTILFI